MPCELTGFRGLDISKGCVLVPEKAFLGVPTAFTFWVCLYFLGVPGLYHPTRFSATCPILLENTRSAEDRYRLLLLNTVHAHCMLVTACQL